jgi:hypothetical protein
LKTGGLFGDAGTKRIGGEFQSLKLMTDKRPKKGDVMINAIGEATMQQFVRTNHNNGMVDKELTVQKTNKIKEKRPVERSEDGQKAKMNTSDEQMKSRNSLENGQLVIEKYDANGKLVSKTPPGFLPFGETA